MQCNYISCTYAANVPVLRPPIVTGPITWTAYNNNNCNLRKRCYCCVTDKVTFTAIFPVCLVMRHALLHIGLSSHAALCTSFRAAADAGL